MDQITITKDELKHAFFDALHAEMTDDAMKGAAPMISTLVMVTGMSILAHMINSLFSAEADQD